MERRIFIKTIPPVAMLTASVPCYSVIFKGHPQVHKIVLPRPEEDGGRSVLASLKLRKTTRSISSKELPEQLLSNLLWAGFGINRESVRGGKRGRTAPSASNSQEIDLYVCLPKAVFLYNAEEHSLILVAEGDYRNRSGSRDALTAPLNIFYIVDTSRYDLGPSQPDRSIGDPEVQKSYYYTDTGFVAQNIYLAAASFGLAAWFHNCDKVNTVKEFYLKSTQRVLFAQTVGYPA